MMNQVAASWSAEPAGARQKAYQPPEEARTDGLVGVAASDEAHPERACADPVREDRPPVARAADRAGWGVVGR